MTLLRDMLFSPNLFAFVIAFFLSTVLGAGITWLYNKYVKNVISIPAVLTTITLSMIFFYVATEATFHPIPLNNVNATIEASVSDAHATWEAEILPTLVQFLQPLQTGTVTFSGSFHVPIHRYSFALNQLNPETAPADITLESCGQAGGARPIIDCNITAVAFYSFGNVPLENITQVDESHLISYFNMYDIKMLDGYSFVVRTADQHLAKFRVINPVIDQDERHYEFTITWVYQPNDRDDFVGRNDE